MEASMLEGVLELIGLLFQVFEVISGLLDLLQFLWTVLNLVGEMIALAWQCLQWLWRKSLAVMSGQRSSATPPAMPVGQSRKISKSARPYVRSPTAS
jgi:hypothetical protein